MQEEVLAISQKELTRYDVLRRMLDGTITLKDAAAYMGVSYRQAIRLKKKAEEGVKGLVHGNRGRPADNRITEEVRARVLELSRGITRISMTPTLLRSCQSWTSISTVRV